MFKLLQPFFLTNFNSSCSPETFTDATATERAARHDVTSRGWPLLDVDLESALLFVLWMCCSFLFAVAWEHPLTTHEHSRTTTQT